MFLIIIIIKTKIEYFNLNKLDTIILWSLFLIGLVFRPF